MSFEPGGENDKIGVDAAPFFCDERLPLAADHARLRPNRHTGSREASVQPFLSLNRWFDVAQTGSLPCRRLPTCDTADCQSALRAGGRSCPQFVSFRSTFLLFMCVAAAVRQKLS